MLEIDGYGPTQTFGARDLDTARMMVLDYLEVIGEPAPVDTTICWIESGR